MCGAPWDMRQGIGPLPDARDRPRAFVLQRLAAPSLTGPTNERREILFGSFPGWIAEALRSGDGVPAAANASTLKGGMAELMDFELLER